MDNLDEVLDALYTQGWSDKGRKDFDPRRYEIWQEVFEYIKGLEKRSSIYTWIANNCEITYNGETIYDEAQLKQYMEGQ